jgi:hypothetical protein
LHKRAVAPMQLLKGGGWYEATWLLSFFLSNYDEHSC